VSDPCVVVANAADVPPGKMIQVRVAGRCLLVANVDGTFFAAADTCTHEDASLSSGSLRGAFVKCPLHGSRFDLRTGRAMDDPAEADLQVFPVTMDGDRIQVRLPETPVK